MDEVVKIDGIEEVVVSTNEDAVIEQAERYAKAHGHVRIDKRPERLCQSTTKVQDLIDYVPTILNGNHVFWLHATSPFVSVADYNRALSQYASVLESGTNDSVMSVNKLQQFIWDDDSRVVINTDQTDKRWPNTQDLKPLYEINHAFYIAPRFIYESVKDRIGLKPALHILEGEKSIDVDWESDFSFAQLVFTALNKAHA